MADSIYDDLEIDFSTMMSNPETFAKQVYEAAEALKTTLKANDSVEDYLKALPAAEFDGPAYEELENSFYNWAETQPIQTLEAISQRLTKLASTIKYLARDKAIYQLASDSDKLDKKTAHIQYTRLKEAFNKYVDAIALFDMGKDLAKLPSMPGNFGAPVGLVNYVFEFNNGEEQYRNHYAVCRKLGLDRMPLMNLIDYIKAHPETACTIKEVKN